MPKIMEKWRRDTHLPERTNRARLSLAGQVGDIPLEEFERFPFPGAAALPGEGAVVLDQPPEHGSRLLT